MPYLQEDMRLEADKVCDIEHMVNYIATMSPDNFVGFINYLNFKIARARFAEGSEYRKYRHMNGWVGAMNCCVAETYRRIIAPYEDEAIKKNGDVE